MTGVSLPVQPQMDCVIRALQTKIRLLGNDSLKPSETGAAAQQMAVDCLTPPTPTK